MPAARLILFTEKSDGFSGNNGRAPEVDLEDTAGDVQIQRFYLTKGN